MKKLTIIAVIAIVTIAIGMMTPNFAANATYEKTKNSKYSDDREKDQDKCDDHKDWPRDHDSDDCERKAKRPTITVYKIITNIDTSTVPPISSFGIKLNNTSVTVNGTVLPVTANKPVVLTESGAPGYKFVEIRGDGHCPENLGGTITLSSGQNISCYIVNAPETLTGPVTPGVIFHYNTLEFSTINPKSHDSCSVPKSEPCVELANTNIDRSILVVDDQLKTDTTIVLFSLVQQGNLPNQFASSPLCVLSGMGPHTVEYAQSYDPANPPTPDEIAANPNIYVTNPTGKLGFEIQCSLMEADVYKISYALIETQRQP